MCDTVFTAFFEQIATNDDDTLGIADISNGRITISPNPANNTVSVKAPEQMQLIEIMDMTGITVMRHPTSSEAVSLDLSIMPTGVYILRLHLPDRSEVRKLVVRH